MSRSLKLIAALAATAVLAVTAIAAAASGAPTQVTVSAVPSLVAGDTSPFHVPGVQAIRRGKPIPAGYVLVGRRVAIKRGKHAAGAMLFFRCPDRRRLKSFATRGQAGFLSINDYVNHRQTYVGSMMTRDATGTVYAVCR
jgi:hypothetical protein